MKTVCSPSPKTVAEGLTRRARPSVRGSAMNLGTWRRIRSSPSRLAPGKAFGRLKPSGCQSMEPGSRLQMSGASSVAVCAYWTVVSHLRDVIARLVQDFRCVCFEFAGNGRSEGLPRDGIRLSECRVRLPKSSMRWPSMISLLIVHDLGWPGWDCSAARMAATGSRHRRC